MIAKDAIQISQKMYCFFLLAEISNGDLIKEIAIKKGMVFKTNFKVFMAYT